jgi:Glyoxalase-like domain
MGAEDVPCLRLRAGGSEVRSGMTCQLLAVCFDANDPLRLARFWAGLLGWKMAGGPRDGVALLPGGDTGFGIRFVPTQQPKAGQNQMHFDLTSASLEDQQQTVARALGLGGRHIDIGQRPEEAHVVLADPGGDEFCVIEPGNEFLAGCGFIGALACDGSPIAQPDPGQPAAR